MFAWAPEKTVTPHQQHQEPATQQSLAWRGSKIYNPVNDCVRLGENRGQSYSSCSPKTNVCILSISISFLFFLRFKRKLLVCFSFHRVKRSGRERASKTRKELFHQPGGIYYSWVGHLRFSPLFLRVWRWHGTASLLMCYLFSSLSTPSQSPKFRHSQLNQTRELFTELCRKKLTTQTKKKGLTRINDNNLRRNFHALGISEDENCV